VELASVLRGEPFQGGVAAAPAYVVNETLGVADSVEPDQSVDPQEERERLESAFETTRVETLCLEKRVASQLSESDAAIFHSHLMILQDNSFLNKIHLQIDRGLSAAQAVKLIVRQYVNAFLALEDPYLRERSVDMEDIGKRILSHLCGSDSEPFRLSDPSIIVARDLLPSEIASLDLSMLRGIVLEAPQSNGHAAIVAKSMGIPTLVAVKGATRQIEPGAPLILDANSGCLYVEPAAGVKSEYQRLLNEDVAEKERLLANAGRKSETADGVAISLRANIGILSDVEVAVRHCASGVGLYRTEFPFMMRPSLPTREEQYQLYRKVVEGFRGEQVTIRTLDIGGDKNLRSFPLPAEENPALGQRSVRVSLAHPEVFRTQVEAILMASVHGPVRMLLPMVTNLEELSCCRSMIQECTDRLVAEGWSITNVPLGVMIEVPAAIAIAEHFAKEADFFALGTNDLIQYLLAADRGNANVREYYDPFHPAVLDAIAKLVAVARARDRELCICGEMASDPACLALLVGLGLREFSVAAPTIPKLKEQLAGLRLETLENLSKQALELGAGREIRELTNNLLGRMSRDP
jgi:phosphotransferase system enzyme I (PtsP)